MNRIHMNYYECFFNDFYALYYKQYAQESNIKFESSIALYCGSYEVITRIVKCLIYTFLNIAFLLSLPVYYLYGYVVFFYLYSRVIFSSREVVGQHFSGEIALVFDEISYDRVRVFNQKYEKSVPIFSDYFNAIGKRTFFDFLSGLRKIYLIPKILITGNLIFFKSLAFYNRYGLASFWNFISIGYLVNRLFYTAAVGVAIEDIASSHRFSAIYSGLRDERYAHVLAVICQRNGIKTCCLPHGLCYNFNYPNGIFGDRYLAFNNSEMEFIRRRYPEKEVELFRWEDNSNVDNRPDLVYFTTSRDVLADREALENILRWRESVFVRLHPNDSSENYPLKGLRFLNDYAASINAKAVISRPSTVLVEAERSGAKVCVMLLSKEDARRFKLYPAFSKSYFMAENLNHINEFINENAK